MSNLNLHRANFIADGVTPWFRAGAAYAGRHENGFTLLAKGFLGGGSLHLEVTNVADPAAEAPTVNEIFRIAEAEITGTITDGVARHAALKAAWVRLVLAGAVGPNAHAEIVS